jgi:hypothetical protein
MCSKGVDGIACNGGPAAQKQAKAASDAVLSLNAVLAIVLMAGSSDLP